MVTLFICSEAGIRGSERTNEERALGGGYYRYNNNGQRYYPYYRNGGNRRYYKRNYYGNYHNDDRNDDDVYGGASDDKWSNVTDDGVSGTFSRYEQQAQESFSNWYQTSPGDWTSQQWAFVGGTTVLIGGLIICFIKCFHSCCCGRNDYDFDDYVAMDSKRNGLKEIQSESTDIDDDATLDQVMRLRSLD